MRSAKAVLAVGLLIALAAPWPSPAAQKPKVRAITAFVRLDLPRYEAQIHEALAVLRKTKAAYEKAGYEVQTIRITTQPFPEYIAGLSEQQTWDFFRAYDALAGREGFLAALGPATRRDGDDAHYATLLGEILLRTRNFDASLIVADESGVHWRSVAAAARLVKLLAERSPQSQANFRFAAAAMVPPETPFYPASFHLSEGRSFAIALESANIVAAAFSSAKTAGQARQNLLNALGEQARAAEAIALQAEKDTGWSYRGIDLSPAPLREVSIGAAIEAFTSAPVGASGTMTAAALITDVLRSIPARRAGYSGLMLPVLEDSVLAKRWAEGRLTLDSLLSYSAVCGTGLDTVPLPGDVSVEQIERIIGDMASLAVKLHKPLSARLMPVAGKKAGERTEFDDPFIVNTVLQPLP